MQYQFEKNYIVWKVRWGEYERYSITRLRRTIQYGKQNGKKVQLIISKGLRRTIQYGKIKEIHDKKAMSYAGLRRTIQYGKFF